MFNTRCCDLSHPDLIHFFLFNVDPDLTFHFDADSELDPDPDFAPRDANLRPLAYIPSTPYLDLHGSTVSIHGTPWLYFEPSYSS
jgi:hypothetical protein